MVIATGTIALQEQLLLKDIPDLLEACDWDYQVALVKGRGRYVCNLRLEQCLDAIKSKEAGLFLFEDELQFNPNDQSEDLFQELSESLRMEVGMVIETLGIVALRCRLASINRRSSPVFRSALQVCRPVSFFKAVVSLRKPTVLSPITI